MNRLKDVLTGLVSVFGFDVYGESGLTTSVRRWFVSFGLALACQFVIDVWLWHGAMSYTNMTAFAIVFGFVVATVILLFDRSILVADLSRSRTVWLPIGGRLLFIFVLALISTVPLQLQVFHVEIDNRVSTAETRLRDRLLTKAKAEIEATYLGENGAITLLLKERNEIEEKTKAEREPQLNALLGSQGSARTFHEEEVKRTSNTLQNEVAGIEGAGLSGTAGEGPATRVAREQKAAAQTAQTAFEEKAAADIAAFNAATSALVEQRKAASVVRENELRGAMKAEMDAVRATQSKELALKYGEQWQSPDGLMARVDILFQMKEESAAVRWACHALEVVMMIISLLVVGMKFMAGDDLKSYYSRAIQARRQQPEAVEALVASGFTDPATRANLAVPFNVLDGQDKLHEMRVALARALGNYWAKVADLCGHTDPGTGLHHTRVALTAGFQKLWDENVAQSWARVQEQMRWLENNGVPTPPWDVEKYGQPEPHGYHPWEVNENEIAGFGWRDPTPQINAAMEALTHLHDLRGQIVSAMFDLKGEVREFVRGHLAAQLAEVHDSAFRFYKGNVLPLRRELAIAEETARRGGLKVPPRPSAIATDEALDNCWLVQPGMLVPWGWTGNLPHIAPAPASPPPATNDEADSANAAPPRPPPPPPDDDLDMTAGQKPTADATSADPAGAPAPAPEPPLPAKKPGLFAALGSKLLRRFRRRR